MREEIKMVIGKAIRKRYGEIDAPFSVEVPENPEYGDYASNAAMVLGRSLGRSPIDIANLLKGELDGDKWRIVIVKPGFINFFLNDAALFSELAKILKDKNKYGRGKTKKEKIQVEFISANPTGPLTLANGRGGFLGDVLSNILEFSGYKIEREYYINDTGNQIIMLGKSLSAAAGFIPTEENFYKGGYVREWAEKNSVKVKKYSANPLKLGQLVAEDFLAVTMKMIKAKSAIHFDRWTSEERDIHKKNFVKKALKIFNSKKLTYKKDGATWLKTTDFGDDKDRVLITSDGYPTYFAADAGHYLETKTRGFDKKINILGPDHYGYVKRIQAAAKIIGFKKSEVIVTQAIRLTRSGEEVKMSKRGGTFVAFEDLIDEAGIDAARFFFLERSPDTHIDFNLDLAREQTKNNPVFYVQYAHARMKSIFRKSGNINKGSANLNLLIEQEEKIIIRNLIRFPEIIEDIGRDYQVQRLIRFTLDLARSFHNLYEKCRIITDEKKLTAARLKLLAAAQIVLGNSLDLLGINAPEQM